MVAQLVICNDAAVVFQIYILHLLKVNPLLTRKVKLKVLPLV